MAAPGMHSRRTAQAALDTALAQVIAPDRDGKRRCDACRDVTPRDDADLRPTVLRRGSPRDHLRTRWTVPPSQRRSASAAIVPLRPAFAGPRPMRRRHYESLSR